MRIILLTLFALATKLSFAQVVTGFYSGRLVNDTFKTEQKYELALSEYRGKITGYSYTTFVRNDTLYYSVKTVKGRHTDTEIIIEDEKIISSFFPEKPNKGVRQIMHIAPTNEDTLRTIKGSWETTRTKVYVSFHGPAELVYSTDSSRSPLIGHLKELGIVSEPRGNFANEEIVKSTKTETAAAKPKQSEAVAKTKNVSTAASQVTIPVSIPFDKRAKKQVSTYNVTSDSLYLSFYDNGVVDGDSISLYMNGEAVLRNVRLNTTANKKTVVLPATETIELILVAENLGSIPPNTGLLIIRDGDQSYQLNFSADLQTNAAIMLKRKKK